MVVIFSLSFFRDISLNDARDFNIIFFCRASLIRLALIPLNSTFSIIGFSLTLIIKVLLLNSTLTFLKKLESYIFFKILLSESEFNSSFNDTEENMIIVSAGILSLPVISILFIIEPSV